MNGSRETTNSQPYNYPSRARTASPRMTGCGVHAPARHVYQGGIGNRHDIFTPKAGPQTGPQGTEPAPPPPQLAPSGAYPLPTATSGLEFHSGADRAQATQQVTLPSSAQLLHSLQGPAAPRTQLILGTTTPLQNLARSDTTGPQPHGTWRGADNTRAAPLRSTRTRASPPA